MLSWDVMNGVREQVKFNSEIISCSIFSHPPPPLSLSLSLSLSPQIARRSWSGHPLARETASAAMATQPKLVVTLPHEPASDQLLNSCL